MAFTTLSTEDRGAVRIICVDRPDKLNALNRQTLAELHIAFEQAANDEAVRVVVLRGAGNRAFVAGADISELASLSPVQARDFSRFGQRLMSKIERLGKPVIGMIDGYALGGGLELAMACHLRIASDDAKLGLPEITLGLLPGFGGTQRLLRLVGRSAALALTLSGKPVDAGRAETLGLVSRVVAKAELETETLAEAERMARAAPQALRAILDTVLLGGEGSIDSGLEFETQAFGLLFSTEDMREGTDAFLNKRKPEFKGL